MAHINDPLAPLLYATQPPEALQRIQQEYGEQAASRAIERTFARLSAKLLAAGVNTFIVAGGETSGTVVEALQVKRPPSAERSRRAYLGSSPPAWRWP